MRLTILSILATCLFPCLVDSTYGQEQHTIYDPGQALWNRIANESDGNDYKTNTTHVNNYGTISTTFMVEESSKDWIDRLKQQYEGSHGGDMTFEPTFFPDRIEIEPITGGGEGDDGTPTSQDRPVRGTITVNIVNPKSNGDGGGSEKSGAIDHNSTRSNSGASDGKKGLNAVNVKVVMTGPGGPLVQDVTIRPEKFEKASSSGGGDDDAQLKQGNDKIVRKKPGRTTYAHITLSSYDDGTDLASWDDGVEKGATDLTNGSSVTLFDMDGEVAAATAIEYGLIAALLRMQQPVASTDPDLENSRTAIEYALIAALLRSSGSQGDLHVWHNGNETVMMNLETGSAVVFNNLPSNGNGSEEITTHIITRKIPTLVGVEQVFLYMETRIGGEDVHVNILIRKKPTL